MKITKNNIQQIYKSKVCSVETMELKGYKWIANLFIDSSGLGQEDEPALTQSQCTKEIEALLAEHGTIYTAISSYGMFQVNLGVYVKGVKNSRIVANNTIEITEHDKRIIRLYDTNILTFNADHTVTINTGGFNTKTTRRRMNEYLPSYIRVYSEDFTLHVRSGDKVSPVEGESITIAY